VGPSNSEKDLFDDAAFAGGDEVGEVGYVLGFGGLRGELG